MIPSRQPASAMVPNLRAIYVRRKYTIWERAIMWLSGIRDAIMQLPDSSHATLEYVSPEDPRFKDAPFGVVRRETFVDYPDNPTKR